MTDNLRIWRAVEKTNPAHTKHVNQRGGFTSISAQYQVLAATAQFGPIGIGWGYITGDPIICDTLVMVPVTLWHGDRANTFGPLIGSDEWKDSKGRIDSDAPKKAITDALTKLLSQLGFNADVFLGKFDDNKYVEAMKREFAEKERAPKAESDPAPKAEPDPAAPITDEQRDWLASKINGAGVPVGDVCQQFEVQSLKELNFGQIKQAVDWLKTQRKAA